MAYSDFSSWNLPFQKRLVCVNLRPLELSTGKSVIYPFIPPPQLPIKTPEVTDFAF
jgi:hypothetical protein